MATEGLVSALINNTAAVAIFLPIAVVLAYARSAYTPLRVKLMRDFLLERLSDQVA